MASIINKFTQPINLDDPLSYGTFIRDTLEFRKVHKGDDFNRFDVPNQLYFKIMFYFWNGDVDDNETYSGGLLAPTWEVIGDSTNYYDYTSAWSFLKMNNEDERAELLKQFINLLSNISTYSPWYFQNITGLDSALNRDYEFKDSNERKFINIKCLTDSFDNRISTLLDLYRTISWSWIKRCEILPSNLRKFDMGIYIFSAPIKNIHNRIQLIQTENNYASIDPLSSSYITSYKYIELHNCEFDYNSPTNTWSDLSNAEGKMPEFDIKIYFDDAYERSYNEFLMRTMGDVIGLDTEILISSTNIDGRSNNNDTEQQDSQSAYNELNTRVNTYNNSMIENALKEVGGAILSSGENILTSAVLGNLHTFSLTQIASQIKGLGQGHVISTGKAVENYIDSKPKTFQYQDEIGNIYKASTISKNI